MLTIFAETGQMTRLTVKEFEEVRRTRSEWKHNDHNVKEHRGVKLFRAF